MSWKGGGGTIKPMIGTAKIAAAKKPEPKASVAASPDKPDFTVSTKSTNEDISIQTLIGDYKEVSTNHGKKVYQKMQQIEGHEDVKVLLYYWDNRDGADFSGWWFGDEVGGSQVWARCAAHGLLPAKIGWKIPWDAAKPEPGILLVEPYIAGNSTSTYQAPAGKAGGPKASINVAKAGAASPAKVGGGPPPAEIVERVQQATEKVAAAEADAKEIIAQGKGLNAQTDEDKLSEVAELLTAQSSQLNELFKSLTQDITDARKAGPSALSCVGELTKLSPRLRTQITNTTAELNKMKGFLRAASNNKKNDAELAGKEEEHAAALKKALPEIKEKVSSAEDNVEAVHIMAAPLVEDPPDEPGEAAEAQMQEIENSATEAQDMITEAKKLVVTKLQAAKAYAPKARKEALEEYTALQERLAEAQKKINPYNNFKKDFQQRAEAKKALSDLVDKLSEAELEVEKGAMLSSAAETGQMSEDEVKSTEEITGPATAGLDAVAKLIQAKLKGAASGPMKDELGLMQARLMESRKKLNGVNLVLKKQRDGLQLQKMSLEATEKVDAAEESLVQCQEAEMPFLKGIEVLPQEESTKAIADSEKASAASGKVIEAAKKFINQKIVEARKHGQDASKLVIEELTELQQRAEEVQKRLNAFKSETVDRKIASVMSEVLDSVTTAERKGKELADATAVFSIEVLDDVKPEDLQAAGEKATAIDKEVAGAVAEARKLVLAKQKESKSPDMAQSLNKINLRLNAVTKEQQKYKVAATTVDRLIQGKAMIVEEEEKLKAGEADVDKAQESGKVEEGEELSDERVKDMDAAMTNAVKVLKSVQGEIQPHLPSALPLLKAPMQEILNRCKAGLAKMDQLRTATKAVREKVMCDVYVKDGKGMADDVETAMNKVSDAELPFLMGTECLPLEESRAAIIASDEAAAAVTNTISNARSWLAAKNIEVKGFKSENAKSSLEEFAKITERINGEAAKLSQFKKDTELRKKAAQVQEAGEKLTRFEADVEKIVEAAKPFGEEQGEDVDLTEQWKSLSALEEDAKTKANEIRTLLAAIIKESTAERRKVHSELNERMQKQSQELLKVRKLVSTHEQKFKARALMEEATTMIQDMEEEVTKATEFCAPLLDQGGETFLVGNRVSVITMALKEHMSEKEIDIEALLTEVNGGTAGNVPKETFVAYLAALPEKFSKEELQLSEERQAAVFEQMDLDKDGEISVSDFKEACKKTYTCIQGVTVSETWDMASKTLMKLEGGETLVTYSAPKRETPEGAPRVHVKIADTDKEGWVTVHGTGAGGKTFLEEKSEFKEWCASVDVKLNETQKSNAQVINFFNAKMKELQASGTAGPLAEAKAELVKLRQTVTKAQIDIDGLKKKMVIGKKNHAVKEQQEANAHIEARERKEADGIMEPARTAQTMLDTELKRLEDVSSPLVSLSGDDLAAFATPLAVQEEVKGIAEAVSKAADETKVLAKDVAEKLPKAAKGPMAEGHKELAGMTAGAGKAAVTISKVQKDIKKACDTIAEHWLKKASSAMREDMLKSEASLDDVWSKMPGAGEDSVSEDDFCKHLVSLEGLGIALEPATLVAQKLGAGSISRRAFQGMVQLFYKVVKEIAITSSFDVDTKEKPLRKAEVDELFEVLEGPKIEEQSGLERVRIRSMNDHVEGWVSVKGNNVGKVFLTETTKPFYTCVKDTALDSEFATGSLMLRTVKAEEVLELLEGPRKEVLKNALRVRGKTSGDGKMGWITVKDTAGNELAVKGGKLYTCTQTVAMTDGFDIKTCKVVKKLSVDEVFTLMEGPQEDEASGITRIKGKSTKDGTEGWVTVKGNAGSVYAKVNEKIWSIVADEVPLQNTFTSKGAATLKMLSKDDGMEVLEGPKEEKQAPVTRMKCRTSGDGSAGWINTEFVKPWSGSYKVLKAAPMHSSKNALLASEMDDSGLVRELAVGEELDLVEGPTEEGEEMRVKCRSKTDGVTGWVSFKDAEGKRLLQ